MTLQEIKIKSRTNFPNKATFEGKKVIYVGVGSSHSGVFMFVFRPSFFGPNEKKIRLKTF